MRKGILAMEELDEVVADNAAVETLEAPAEETEGLAEVEAAETEVVADTEETGEVIETADTLDEVREGVEEAAETEGGLAEPEARALNAAVEGLLITLGARGANAKVFPAMEGFRDPATRARVTMEAAGGIGDKVKQVWAKLVEMLKKAWEMISNFFKAITTAAGRLGMRAEKVKKAAAKNSGWTGRRPVATKKWGAKLSVGTSVAGGAESSPNGIAAGAAAARRPHLLRPQSGRSLHQRRVSPFQLNALQLGLAHQQQHVLAQGGRA